MREPQRKRKIDMMEERERDRSGRDRKRGCVGERENKTERGRVGNERGRVRKKQGLVEERENNIKRDRNGREKYRKRDRLRERERYGWQKRER